MFDNLSKVWQRWTEVLRDGQLWTNAAVCIALRKKLKKELLNEDFGNFIQGFNYTDFADVAKGLEEDDFDKALCNGREVYLKLFSQPWV